MYHKAKTLVIGGGAIGTCCAHYLHEQGKDVTVIDKKDICSGASYGNAGLIVPSYSIPLAAPGVISQGLKWVLDQESPFYIKPRLSRELFWWLWKFRAACNEHHVRGSIPVLRDLSFESLRLFDELAAMKGVHFGFEKRGLIEIFDTRKGFGEGIEAARLLQEYGIEIRILQRAELDEFTGGVRTNAVGGLFSHRDALLIPDRFVKQLAQHAVGKGVHVLTPVEVLGFETSGRKATMVHTTRGDIAFEELVLAGGSWCSDIVRDLKIRLMIEPAKGYSITFKKPPTCPDIPYAMAEAKVVLTPMEDMVRFAGTLELAGFDQSINRRKVRSILKTVARYFPDMDPRTMELIEIWRGLRPCTPDGLPYIGRPCSYDNVIVAAGHGMLGISTAPATGKIVSQLATNKKPSIDLSAFSIERFS